MRRAVPVLAAALFVTACSAPIQLAPFDRSSAVRLVLDEGETIASDGLLAFDPTRHSLEISIFLPLEEEGFDVYFIPTTGIRYQVMSSLHNCQENRDGRRCLRHLPSMPGEGIEDWTVEVARKDSTRVTAIDVKVTWVPNEG